MSTNLKVPLHSSALTFYKNENDIISTFVWKHVQVDVEKLDILYNIVLHSKWIR